MFNKKLYNLNDVGSSILNETNNNSLYKFSRIIQNFYKINIKEREPTTQNIDEIIFEEDLGIVVDDLFNFCFKEVNEGKEESVIKQHVLDYINNHKLDLHEFYNWFLNNQNNSNSIYLLGYFNCHGINLNINKQKAFELFEKAAKSENNAAQFVLACMYIDGAVSGQNYNKAFEISEKLAEKGYSCGINLLAYCYVNGIGTNINMQKGVELYQITANIGNCLALYNLAYMYNDGYGVEVDYNKSFKLFEKSAKKGHSDAISMLGYYYSNGIGTDANKEKAFESYQMAANLGNSCAQYNLALMYENGHGTEKNMEKAIYWYIKSDEQEYDSSQDKLNFKLNFK
ncbi:hypothetical protein RclHR1_00680014 [Rhizophagus clarus]|uniref:Kinase-like domain-containing protein n=1 Tax=Rhizophagus clarus TaxID=94130 RepID=A0A2Z6S9Y6_9GLOM|nr:hypothetical protein RclHR1_00680014 [Rhizophagus clarus]GES91014.1 kinase-like domain-containing protein [Rhizophagus clarus]